VSSPVPTTAETAQRSRPPDFHAELDAERGKGLLTRVLTGYEENTKVYYAAFWTK
jgi:hypothetical protein